MQHVECIDPTTCKISRTAELLSQCGRNNTAQEETNSGVIRPVESCYKALDPMIQAKNMLFSFRSTVD
jgi:hypothetical protein